MNWKLYAKQLRADLKKAKLVYPPDSKVTRLLAEWKRQTERVKEAEKQPAGDLVICPQCYDQILFCGCEERTAQTILELIYEGGKK